MYPMDEQLIELNMVDHLQGLGFADHFQGEIQKFLQYAYRYTHMFIFENIAWNCTAIF